MNFWIEIKLQIWMKGHVSTLGEEISSLFSEFTEI